MNAKRKGRLFGYARVSSSGQDLTVQLEALERAGCAVIRQEKVSGTSRKGRSELETLLQFLSESDTLVVTRIDRLARSMKDLQDIVHELKAKGVALRATEQPIDTGSAAGKAFLDMLGVFSEFETNLRRERQMEGIKRAKAGGVYRGRAHGVDPQRVQTLKNDGMTPTQIAREMGISRPSVYEALKISPEEAAKVAAEIADRRRRRAAA